MSGKRSRDKGARFERFVANELAAVYPTAVRGCGQYHRGSNKADVEGTPYWIECKVGKRPSVYGAWDQAVATGTDKEIVVVTKRDRDQALVTITLDKFIEIIKK